MADAASNLAGALICYLALRPGDFLAIDKKSTGSSNSGRLAYDRALIFLGSYHSSTGTKIGYVQGQEPRRKRGESVRHVLATFIALPVVMVFMGCADLTTTQKGAAIGGLGGAAAGGLVGSAVRHPVAGALIGGALGAGGGALIGNQLQGQEEVQYQQQQEINRQSSELQRQREELQRIKRQGEY
jgi:Glycine zipper